jgi:hypothetical protein
LELDTCGIRKQKVRSADNYADVVYYCNIFIDGYRQNDPHYTGIWVWGSPVEVDIGGSKVSVLYLDTEGFESVGKSNVYDDRFVADI